MKWGKTLVEREKKAVYKAEWHRWFAWYPVRLSCGITVWMEVVERQIIGRGSCKPFIGYRGI